MGGGGHGGGTTYKGYTIPHNKRWHTVAGKGLCAVMWYAPHASLARPFPPQIWACILADRMRSVPPLPDPRFVRSTAQLLLVRDRLVILERNSIAVKRLLNLGISQILSFGPYGTHLCIGRFPHGVEQSSISTLLALLLLGQATAAAAAAYHY